MARRAWTEAEERIIAWAQLSGITAQDFQRIGGRLRREEQIAERAQEIERTLTGVAIDPWQHGWLVTIPHSQSFKFNSRTVRCNQFYVSKTGSYPSIYTTQVMNADGLAFSQFKFTANRWTESQWPSRVYPYRNKELFTVVRAVLRGGAAWKDLRRPVQILSGNVAQR